MNSKFDYIPATMARPSYLVSPPATPMYQTPTRLPTVSLPAHTAITPRLPTIPLPPYASQGSSQLLSYSSAPVPQQQPLLLHPLLAPQTSAHFDYSRRISHGNPDLMLPATYPATPYLRIVTRDHPWTIEVTEPRGGILTVGHVFDAIYDALHLPIENWKLEIASPDRRRMISKAYQRRVGSDMEDDLRRVDWLGGRTVFDGLRKDDGESLNLLMLPSNHDRNDWQLHHTLVICSRHR